MSINFDIDQQFQSQLISTDATKRLKVVAAVAAAGAAATEPWREILKTHSTCDYTHI